MAIGDEQGGRNEHVMTISLLWFQRFNRLRCRLEGPLRRAFKDACVPTADTPVLAELVPGLTILQGPVVETSSR